MTEQGLAESRQKAQAVIMAGQVYVDGQKVDKAGAPVGESARIEVRGNDALCEPGRSEAGKGHGLLADLSGGGSLCRYRRFHRRIYRLYAPKRGG